MGVRMALRWAALVAAIWAIAAAAVFAQPSGLSELSHALGDAHVLRVENARLSAGQCDTQARLASAVLTAERAQLEQRFRDEVKPPPGSIFDWQAMTFVAPKEPAK
jgi:hypothetical protein